MYIGVELLHKLVEALGQLLLVAERHHQPVGLLYVDGGVLKLQVDVIGGHLHVDVCHPVQCRDGTAHVERLAHHHRAGKHVAGVGAKGILEGVAQFVALDGESLSHGTHIAAQGLGGLWCDEAVFRHLANKACQAL